MAYNYKYAIKFSTENMVTRAYKDYTADVSAKYTVLMNAVQSVIDRTDSNSDLDVIVDDVIREMGTDYSRTTNVPYNEGVSSLYDYLLSFAKITQEECIEIDTQATNMDDIIYDRKLPLKALDGSLINITTNEMLQEMNATFHSIVVENAIATAYDVTSNISERIQIIRDTIGQKFQNMYVDVSDALNRGIDKVKSGVSATDYITEKLETSGINNAADFNINIAESVDAKYTGASPASAFAWSAAGNKLIQVATVANSIIYSTVKTAFTSIISLGKKLFKKVTSKLTQILVNPEDLVKINDEHGNHTIDGFYVTSKTFLKHGSHLISMLDEGPVHFDLFCGEIIVQKNEGQSTFKPYGDIVSAFKAVASKQGKTLDLNLGLLNSINSVYGSTYTTILDAAVGITSEHLHKPTILGVLNTYLEEEYKFFINVLVRPKILNYRLFNFDYAKIEIDDTFSFKATDFISCVMSAIQAQDLYLDVDSNENDLYLGYAYGFWITDLATQALMYESEGYDLDTQERFLNSKYSQASLVETIKLSGVTNKDFMIAATTGNFTGKNGGTIAIRDIGGWAHMFVTILSNIIDYKRQNPFDYAFWPYSRHYVQWFDASFRIKTDADNQTMFADFVTKAVTITLVATIAISSFVLLKRIATRRMVDAMGQQWNVTEAAQKGVLTNKDIGKWKKSERKANHMSMLVSNLQDAGTSAATKTFSNVENYGDIKVDLSPVISLIKG